MLHSARRRRRVIEDEILLFLDSVWLLVLHIKGQ